MSQRDHRRDHLGHLISDMECDVADMLRWATVVYDLGSSDNCDREGVQVVGFAMQELAKRVLDSWQAAFDLSHDLRRAS